MHFQFNYSYNVISNTFTKNKLKLRRVVKGFRDIHIFTFTVQSFLYDIFDIALFLFASLYRSTVTQSSTPNKMSRRVEYDTRNADV